MVASADMDGAPLERADDRDERRVRDRDGEDEQRQEHRRERRRRGLPARASAIAASEKPITWLPESPRKTAAGFLRRTLKGRKPAHANATERESTRTRSFECT